MSGFEIAGAVLAAVPLVIAALNLYADGKFWWRDYEMKTGRQMYRKVAATAVYSFSVVGSDLSGYQAN